MISRSALPLLLCALGLSITGCRTTSGIGHAGPESSLLPHVVRDARAGFAARMPTEPNIVTDGFDTVHGPLRSVTYTAEQGTAVYVVTFNQFPPGALAEGTTLKHLEGARDGSLRSTGGELLEERILDVDGHTALEMAVRVDGGAYRTRIVFDGPRMLQVLVATQDERDVFSELSELFLGSLVIEPFAEI